MKWKTLSVALCALLSACAGQSDYHAYLAAQQQMIRDAALAQKPLVRIEAEPGQTVTGLKSIEVYAPTSGQPAMIQQARPNEWVGVLGTGLQVLGVLGGIKYSGEAAVNLTRAVGNTATHGYQYVNPTPVIAPDPVVVQQPAPVIVPPANPVIVPPIIVRPEVVIP